MDGTINNVKSGTYQCGGLNFDPTKSCKTGNYGSFWSSLNGKSNGQAFHVCLCKACFTFIVRPFGLAFLSRVTERRGRETDFRQLRTESHLT